MSPNFLAVANDDAEGEGEDGSPYPGEELLNEGREKGEDDLTLTHSSQLIHIHWESWELTSET